MKFKKIALITILDNINLGTYLQALALGLVFKQKGCEVEIIDYHRKVTTLTYVIKTTFKKNVVKILYNILYNIPETFYLKNKDRRFLRNYLSFSSIKYTSYQALKTNPPKADIYVTGSDQVWNSVYNRGIERAFYLDFLPLNTTACRAAYAASIGMDMFPKDEVKETKSLIARYDYLSVRETHAKKILNEIGFDNVEIVLDPTLLLSKSDWAKLINNNVFFKREQYLLIYSVETNKENSIIKNIATQIAKEKGYAIYNVSCNDYFHKLSFCDRNYMRATPDLFLSLMYNADFIVASSFHGTAFSINMNKEFLSITPNKFNSRVNSLLDLFDLKNRLVTDFNFQYENMEFIDYNKINVLLKKERATSLMYIDKVIESDRSL